MTFSGPSVHRCKCWGEGDGRGGTWYPCPPDLCEAGSLLDAIIEAREWLRKGDVHSAWSCLDRAIGAGALAGEDA